MNNAFLPVCEKKLGSFPVAAIQLSLSANPFTGLVIFDRYFCCHAHEAGSF
jgi:hypothetical protein